MKKQLTTTALIFTTLTGFAHAAPQCPPAEQTGWYGQISGYGVHTANHTMKYNTGVVRDMDTSVGSGAGLALGYQLPKGIRIEAEMTYRQNEVDYKGLPFKIDEKSLAGMANVYSDIAQFSNVVPYVGAGVGGARVSEDGAVETVPAFQLMTGVNYVVNPQLAFLLGYKFFETKSTTYDFGSGVNAKVPYRTHNAELGMRYHFN